MGDPMEADGSSQKRWNNAQAYGLAIGCLALGVAAGYLIHARLQPPAPPSAPRQQAHQLSPHAGGVQVTAEQLKHMADKQAEPLLAKLEQNPNDADVLAELGKAYLYVREFQRSTDYYERSVKIKPDPRVLTTLGGAYHLAGADDKAIDAWSRALQLDPGYADALYNLGLVKWQAGSDPGAAIEAWSKLLQTNPNHPRRAQVEAMIARAKKHASMPADR